MKNLNFEIPDGLHKKLKQKVLKEGTTLRVYITEVLENSIRGRKK